MSVIFPHFFQTIPLIDIFWVNIIWKAAVVLGSGGVQIIFAFDRVGQPEVEFCEHFLSIFLMRVFFLS